MGFSEGKSVEEPSTKLFHGLGYDSVDLFYEKFGDDNALGRKTSSEVVLSKILRQKLVEFNPILEQGVIDAAIEEITRDRSSLSLIRANQEVYGLLKEGAKIQTVGKKGEVVTETVKIIDWNDPDKNHFLLASQMWISGELHSRRPDMVGFVNGIPLILFE